MLILLVFFFLPWELLCYAQGKCLFSSQLLITSGFWSYLLVVFFFPWKQVLSCRVMCQICKRGENETLLEDLSYSGGDQRGGRVGSLCYVRWILHESLFSSSEKMEDCLAKKMEITVSEAEKQTGRNAMNMQETYTAYLIETRWVMRTRSQ